MKPIKWEDTIAYKCRWSENAEYLFEDWTILIDCSENYYQGEVCILAVKNNEYRFLEYSYGSCSGCDIYEELENDEIQKEFKKLTITFPNTKALCDQLDDVNVAYKDPDYGYYDGLEKIKLELNKFFGSEDYVKNPDILERRINTILVLS